jgi:aminoglycoside phosphotransferase (APT) family kinase protein
VADAVPIPVETSELTPAWLGLVLRAPVVATEVLESHSGTTGRIRLGLTYGAGTRDDLPASVFVKLPPFDVAQRGFVDRVGLGIAEARFYRELASEAPVRVPRAWFAALDGENRYVMVLEDLRAAGCRFPRPRDPDVAERSGAVVEAMARLHARYWETPRFGGDLAWVAARGTGERGAGGELVAKAKELLGDRLPAAFARTCDFFVAHVGAITELWNEGPRTLVHGDAHMGNLFVDGEVAGFLDWAMVGRASGLRDVAYYCCNSVPAAIRREHERAWLERYRSALAEGGVALGAEAAWDGYRLFALYSWLAATSTAAMGSLWQPEHVGLGGTERATASIDELDCLGFLRSRLGTGAAS